MKKLIPFLIVGLVVGYFLLGRGQSGFLKKEIKVGQDVCAEFPKEFVESVTGKKILKTTRFDMKEGTHVCDYYTTENDFLSIHVEDLSFETQKKGLNEMGRPTKTDPSIKMEHFVSWQGNDLYGVYLKLNDNKFISVDRGTLNASTNEENMKLAVAVVDRIQKGENQGLVSAPTAQPTKKSGNNIIPLPQEKDIINNFFTLIDEGKASDAVMMMPAIITKDDSIKQAFGVQFAAMKSVKVKKIEEAMKEDWTGTRHEYMVTLDVVMDPSSVNQPIPYYGFENGENVRFVGLVKENNQWKVEGMATGP